MCFDTKTYSVFRIFAPRPKTAKKDIVIYKLVKKNIKGYVPYFIGNMPPYKLYERYYAKNINKFQSGDINILCGAIVGIKKFSPRRACFEKKIYYRIYAGIHSYKQSPPLTSNDEYIMVAIIPKGEKYYENETEYVSLSIIPTDIVAYPKDTFSGTEIV